MANDIGILTLSAALRDNSGQLTNEAKKMIQKVEKNAGDIDLNIGIDKIRDTLNEVNSLASKKLKNVDLTKYYMDFTNQLLTAKKGTLDYENAIDTLYKKIRALSNMSKGKHAHDFETFNSSQLEQMISLYEMLEDAQLKYEKAMDASKADAKNIKGKSASDLMRSTTLKYKDNENLNKYKDNIPTIKKEIKANKDLNAAQEATLSRYSKFVTAYELLAKEAPDLKNVSSEKEAKQAIEYYKSMFNMLLKIRDIEKEIGRFSKNSSKYFDSKKIMMGNYDAKDNGSFQYMYAQAYDKLSKIANENIKKSIADMDRRITKTIADNVEKNKAKIGVRADKIIESANQEINKKFNKKNESVVENIVNQKDIDNLKTYTSSTEECVDAIKKLDIQANTTDDDDKFEQLNVEKLKYFAGLQNLHSGDIPKDILDKIDKDSPGLSDELSEAFNNIDDADDKLRDLIYSIYEYKGATKSSESDSIISEKEEGKIKNYNVLIDEAKQKAIEISKLKSLQGLDIDNNNKDDFKNMIGYMQRYIDLGGKIEDFNIGMQKRFYNGTSNEKYKNEIQDLISSLSELREEELKSSSGLNNDLLDENANVEISKLREEIRDLYKEIEDIQLKITGLNGKTFEDILESVQKLCSSLEESNKQIDNLKTNLNGSENTVGKFNINIDDIAKVLNITKEGVEILREETNLYANIDKEAFNYRKTLEGTNALLLDQKGILEERAIFLKNGKRIGDEIISSGKAEVDIGNKSEKLGADTVLHTHPYSSDMDNLRFNDADIQHLLDGAIDRVILLCGDEIATMDASGVAKESLPELRNGILDIYKSVFASLGAEIKGNKLLNTDSLTPDIQDKATHLINNLMSNLLDDYGGKLDFRKFDLQNDKILSNNEIRLSGISDGDYDRISKYNKALMSENPSSAIKELNKEFNILTSSEKQVSEEIEKIKKQLDNTNYNSELENYLDNIGSKLSEISTEATKTIDTLRNYFNSTEISEGFNIKLNPKIENNEWISAVDSIIKEISPREIELKIKDSDIKLEKEIQDDFNIISDNKKNIKNEIKKKSQFKNSELENTEYINGVLDITSEAYDRIYKAAKQVNPELSETVKIVRNIKKNDSNSYDISYKVSDDKGNSAVIGKNKKTFSSNSVINDSIQEKKALAQEEKKIAEQNQKNYQNMLKEDKTAFLNHQSQAYSRLNESIKEYIKWSKKEIELSDPDFKNKATEYKNVEYDKIEKIWKNIDDKGLTNHDSDIKALEKLIQLDKDLSVKSSKTSIKPDISNTSANDIQQLVRLQSLRDKQLETMQRIKFLSEKGINTIDEQKKLQLEIQISSLKESLSATEQEINQELAKELNLTSEIKRVITDINQNKENGIDGVKLNKTTEKKFNLETPEKINAINAAISKSGDLLNRVFNKNSNITGFDKIFSKSLLEIENLNKKLRNGEISLESYDKQVKKTYNNLNNIIGIINPSDIKAGKSEMLKYADNLSDGKFEFKNFTNLKNDIITLNGQFKDNEKNVNSLKLEYNSLNGVISKVLDKENSVPSAFEKFFSGVKSKFADVAKYVLSFVSLYEVWDLFKRGITEVKNFDTAMVELRKVSNDSLADLEAFGKESFDIANQIGRTGVEVTNSAADWSRLGYSIKEASELAKDSAIYSNVGDMDINTATEHMTSTLKAFGKKPEEALSIVDKFNEVGNNFAISSEGIGAALERSGAALKAAGNDLDESIALITAANESQQDPETVGNAMKVVALRVRGAKTELESMGEETDGLAESTSKLRDELLALTGVDIMESDGKTFKSTYQQLLEISKVFDKLSDVSQANVLEKLAGKTRSSVVAGLLKNMSQAEKVLSTSQNSAGSALEENEEQLKSIEGHLNKLKNTWQELWTSGVSRDFVNLVLDFTNGLLKVADALGVVGVAILGISAYVGAKKLFGANSKKEYLKDIRDSLNPEAAKENLGLKEKIKSHLESAAAKKADEAASKNLAKAEFEEAVASTASSTAEKQETASNIESTTTETVETIANKANAKSEYEEALASNASANADALESAGNIKAAGTEAAETASNLANATSEISASSAGIGTLLLNLVKMHPAITAITIAIGGTIAAITSYSKSMKEAIDNSKNASKEFSSTSESLSEQKSKITELKKEINSGELTESEIMGKKSELLSIQQSLTDSYKDQANGLDLVNGNLETQIGLIDRLNKKQAEKLLNENVKGNTKIKEKMESKKTYDIVDLAGLNDKTNITSSVLEIVKKFEKKGLSSESLLGEDGVGQFKIKFTGDVSDAENVLNEFATEVRNLQDNIGENNVTNAVLEGTSNQLSSIKKIMDEYGETYKQIKLAEMISDSKTFTVDYDKKSPTKTYDKLYQDYVKSIKDYNEALSSQDEDLIKRTKNTFRGVQAAVNEFVTDENYGDLFKNVASQLNEAAANAERFKSSLAYNDNFEKLKNLSLSDVDFKVAVETQGFQKGETEINSLIQSALDMGVISDKSSEQIEVLTDILIKLGIISSSSSKDVKGLTDSFKTSKSETQKFISEVNSITEALNGQTTGKSINLETFYSDAVNEYSEALEYNNGSLRLNEEKVRSLTKAKAEEKIATLNNKKALSQQDYIKNSQQIDLLKKKILDKNFAEGESSKSIESQISILSEQNNLIASQCDEYDLMTASIREAIGAYTEWQNAQNAPESGDIFDDTSNMIQLIRNVNDHTTEDYMKTGTQKYKTAVEFMVPDKINKDDQEAVKKYIESVENYLTHDKDGKITGLNVQQFLDKSVEEGLMKDITGKGDYEIIGKKSMRDFANGLNLSLPMVKAVFGELEEYNFKFDWTDEATKSVNDFAMAGVEAANKLNKLKEEKNLDFDLVVNVSDLDTAEEKAERLDDTIKSMDDYRATLKAGSEEYEQAGDVIAYCNMQKAILEQPIIMEVNTDLVNDKIKNVITTLQEFQKAKNELEQLKVVGADTTEAQEKMDELLKKVQELQKSDVDIFANLGIDDTSSIEKIEESLKKIDTTVLLKVGIPEDAFSEVEDKTTITIDANNLASEKLERVKREAEAIDKLDPEVLVDATTYEAYTKLDYLLGKIKEIQRNSNISTTVTTYTKRVNLNESPESAFVNGTAHVRGTAYVNGNAKLQGDWGMDSGERVLIGELGREIVVDPNTGKWRTYGDNGAEFAYIPRDAIIFNHLQSESLLKQGFVNSRATMSKGKAFAGGNAKVSGGGSWKPSIPQANVPYKPNYASNADQFKANTSATKDNTKALEKSSQKFDWIERRIKYFAEKTKDIADRISEFITTGNKNNLINQQIESIKEEIAVNNSAFDAYLRQANDVGLSSYYKDRIISGVFSIEEIDTTDGANKGLIDQIQTFQDYYDKAKSCSSAIVELNKNLAELAKQKFDNVSSEYDSRLSELEHMTSMIDGGLKLIEAQGRFASENYYTALIDVEKKNISVLEEEYKALNTSLAEAMGSGKIEEYSEAWYDMKDKINSVQEALQEANISLVEYKNQMREMDWSVFEKTQEYISKIADESDFLIDLLDNDKLFDDKGKMNEKGQAVAGLHAVKYNTYMSQADEYAKEIEKINKEIADDPYNTKLVDKRNELLQSQMDSIKAAEDEKQAIKDLISQGYDKMLESLQKVIDKKKESLQAEKDLYDYEKSITEKTKEISDYQKQLSALENDDSEESQSKKQQLQVSLDKAKEELKETEYDKWLSDQEKLMDDFYSEYEEFLNARLDDINGLLSEVISSTNDNAENINQTIKDASGEVGYKVSDAMNTIWNSTQSGLGKVVSDYSADFTSKMTSVQATIDGCKNYLASILDQVKKDTSVNTGGVADGNGNVKPPTIPTPNPTPPPTPPSNDSSSDSSSKGSFFVHKKDYYPKNKLDINYSIVDRLKYHDFDSSFAQCRNYYVAMGLGSASSYRGTASQNVKMIQWMKSNGFSKGGTIGKAIKTSGESGFFLGRTGEEVLSIPKLELASGMVDKLINFNTIIPDVNRIRPIQSTGNIHFVVEEMNLPNVTNSKEFAGEFIKVLKTDNNIQKAIRSVSTDLIVGKGKNSLNVMKFK